MIIRDTNAGKRNTQGRHTTRGGAEVFFHPDKPIMMDGPQVYLHPMQDVGCWYGETRSDIGQNFRKSGLKDRESGVVRGEPEKAVDSGTGPASSERFIWVAQRSALCESWSAALGQRQSARLHESGVFRINRFPQSLDKPARTLVVCRAPYYKTHS